MFSGPMEVYVVVASEDSTIEELEVYASPEDADTRFKELIPEYLTGEIYDEEENYRCGVNHRGEYVKVFVTTQELR